MQGLKRLGFDGLAFRLTTGGLAFVEAIQMAFGTCVRQHFAQLRFGEGEKWLGGLFGDLIGAVYLRGRGLLSIKVSEEERVHASAS